MRKFEFNMMIQVRGISDIIKKAEQEGITLSMVNEDVVKVSMGDNSINAFLPTEAERDMCRKHCSQLR